MYRESTWLVYDHRHMFAGQSYFTIWNNLFVGLFNGKLYNSRLCVCAKVKTNYNDTIMSKVSVNTEWKGNMKFEADVFGHKIVVDADEASGGEDSGARPKPLLLVALAGCTGMDVVSILKKMHVAFDGLNIMVEADQTEEHPKHYEAMKVIYEFKGKDLPMDKLTKAVELSEERYCGVNAMFKKAMKMSYEIRVVE
ncbi:putative redox protein [Williamwhitmania taraxaci]|uniref:Putative redox protein n=2 Tax=Williamwhitmania taraxaci TaxID=1640674 RepID=A0A1G6Q3H5_9BACT|nr:putative redox protein [Williamwhitmania taraxaci]